MKHNIIYSQHDSIIWWRTFEIQAIVTKATLPTKLEFLSSLRIFHPLLRLQVYSLRFASFYPYNLELPKILTRLLYGNHAVKNAIIPHMDAFYGNRAITPHMDAFYGNHQIYPNYFSILLFQSIFP